jgi:hypothetical protein
MKFAFLILFILMISACAKEPTKADHLSDDYVLIEFAASLEDEYDKLYPAEKKNEKEKAGPIN